ncbi:hypothetical protein HRI_000733700 [Hibiscus trionum]|uniref:PB1 domain-containing protein n=1 Tax=Hibiscus trionum TaxID=183268 RepID=A0A9W7H3Y9_HIBTR|nr:hypothetical protein HRI_000733700 [Hibiscus trionum]
MTASETVGSDEGMASSPMNPSSPRNRVKFLCSYGGKILPRPSDGQLKYVGGETRMVAVPGDIKFLELMKKVKSMVEGDVVMKFLAIPEELDALVTVKSDEDVKHMVDEYRRLESEGTPKLRVFLFPSNPIVVDHVDPSYSIELRYIEAINGIARPTSNNTSGRQTPVHPNRSIFSISACTSPKEPSPDPVASSYPMDPSALSANQHNKPPMPKVRSSPSLYNLSAHHVQSNNTHSNHQVYQPHHHYHQNHQQLQPYSVQSPRTSPDFWAEKPPGPHDFTRGAMGHGHVPVNRVYPMGRHNMGNGYQGCDDYMAYASGGSSRRVSPSASGRLDKPDSPGHKSHMPE